MNKRAFAVVGLLALGISLFAAAPPATAASAGSSYVAFGDSEAAGTGNLLYVDRSCLRSRLSYPLMLGATSYACAGAKSSDLLGQVNTAVTAGKLGASTKRVTITAGVNDLKWVDVLTICYTQGDDACRLALTEAGGLLPAVTTNTAAAIVAIRASAPHATIIVTGYPRLFGNVATSCKIGSYQGTQVTVTATQAGLANGGVDALNYALATAVSSVSVSVPDAKVKFLDLTSTFAGHGLCDTKLRWINGVIGLPVLSDGSLHVNVAGQLAIAAAVLKTR
ncbi:SGNH/GDSL hydrolase family protein [Microbacterium lacus]|uniref:SGNH/GDSL hydrolase family protein n=1 Tax=Microbacterium lacus TaxID=415217 RepID=UPI003850C2B6